MKRIKVILAAAAAMTTMMVLSAPAMAQTSSPGTIDISGNTFSGSGGVFTDGSGGFILSDPDNSDFGGDRAILVGLDGFGFGDIDDIRNGQFVLSSPGSSFDTFSAEPGGTFIG